jgi:hypothetical protein
MQPAMCCVSLPFRARKRGSPIARATTSLIDGMFSKPNRMKRGERGRSDRAVRGTLHCTWIEVEHTARAPSKKIAAALR